MNRVIVSVVLLCFGLSIEAQVSSARILSDTAVFQKEIPEIIINNELLLTGEHLYYKTFNLEESGKTSYLSKIAYVSLRTDKDSIIFNHKLKLRNGSADGSFFIPTSLETGCYRLVGYTNFSLNNIESAVALRKIYIVNPYLKSADKIQNDTIRTRETLSFTDAANLSMTNESASKDLSITTNKHTYGKREKISLSIENPNGKFGFGNYTLSVRKIDPVEVLNLVEQENGIEPEIENLFHIPEIRGELISGKVLTIDNNVPVANKIVALSIPGEDYIFKSAKTNLDGRFYISIDESYETTNCVIQIYEPNRELYRVVLDEKELNFSEKVELPILKLDSNLKYWLAEHSVQLQIQNAYFKQDTTVVKKGSRKPFYGSLGTEFILNDYARFPSLEETFVEVVTLARIREKDGKSAFEVFNPFNPYKSGPFSSLDPLLLLDGILVQPGEVFSYSVKEIESILVFPEPYRYGPKIYQGIIDFKTKTGDYRPRFGEGYIMEFEMVKPFPDKEYTTPDHSIESNRRLPDYRTQLLWEPSIDLKVKKLKKEFYSSDVKGTYQFRLEGYTNNGQYTVEKHYIIVD